MKIITTNKKAFFNYSMHDSLEAGIALTGDEVKSIRANNINIGDAFATVHNGEIQLLNCYIGPYSHAYNKTDTSRRSRTLLLKRKEINRLVGDLSRKGLTLIPLKVYFNIRGYVKIELGLAKHKKAVDKKDSLKERDIKRETAREMKIKIR